ncbi:MAG: hypothetical protein AAB394_03165 [Patescibacteria group bacterium]
MRVTAAIASLGIICLSYGAFLLSDQLGKIKGFLEALCSSGFRQNIAQITLATRDMIEVTDVARRGFIFMLVSSVLLIVSIIIK